MHVISDAQAGREVILHIPFSSGEGFLAAEAEPLDPSPGSVFWSVVDF